MARTSGQQTDAMSAETSYVYLALFFLLPITILIHPASAAQQHGNTEYGFVCEHL